MRENMRENFRIPNAPRGGVQYVEDFFIYSVSIPAGGLAPGASVPINFQIQADSDFKWSKATQFFWNNAGATNLQESTRVLPLVTVQVTDQGSGRNLFSNPADVPAVFGDGRIPFILPIVRIFKARSTVQVTLSNFDTGITYAGTLHFIGTKLFEL